MSNVCPASTSWDEILTEKRDPRRRLIAWRFLRQFASDSEIELEFGFRPQWHWTIENQPLTISSQAAKLLLRNQFGVRCETVVLFPDGRASQAATGRSPRSPRATACISSQPGCGVGCPFCATASLGYRGDLSAQEIVEQVYLAGQTAKFHGRRLRNIVYMGMGEPLHNVAAVFESLRILTSDAGFGFSPQRITLSTAGVPMAMRQLAQQFPRVRLALSLHAAEPRLRKQLVPRAVSDLGVLREVIRDVNADQTQPVWLEVVLLDGLNDSLDHARMLLNFCRDLRVEVNLIPYNTTSPSERFACSPRPVREAFARVLREAGIRTSMRTSFGSRSSAACGQLTAQPLANH